MTVPPEHPQPSIDGEGASSRAGAPSGRPPITRMLHEVATAGPEGKAPGGAVERLMREVYEELKAIAESRMKGERDGHSLQATALVNEAFVRMFPVGSAEGGGVDASAGAGPSWENRAHFFFAAARAMQHILVEHARARGRIKRGGGAEPVRLATVSLNVVDLSNEADEEQIVALEEAIGRLEERDARAAHIVRLRFYAGLSVEETAAALALSDRTVKREWSFARAWLFEQLNGSKG